MEFTKKDTMAMKGIAIIMMIIHHCFFETSRYEGYNIVFAPLNERYTVIIASFFKICVGIFVFLSGFGITKSIIKISNGRLADKQTLKKVVFKTYIALMFGFIFVFILSQLFCWFANKGQIEIYKSNNIFNSISYFIADGLGLANLFGTPTLNGTWWYMSLAIIIVVITPLLYNLIKKYGLTAVNLCEVDTGFAKEISNVFKKIYSEYPEARGYLTNLSLANVKITEGYIAAFMPVFIFATSNSDNQYPAIIKTQILLNSSYFLNKERLNNSVTSGSKTGHFPKNATMYSPVAHELGHYLSFLAMMKSYNMESILLIDNNKVYDLNQLIEDFSEGNHSLKMINEAYEKYKKDTKDNIEFDKWRATISGYAVAKKNNGQYIYDETIAESFHDVYLNGNKASTASKYIINVLKEKLKG